ncbi:hypothetical protein G3N95_30220 [Paraburkholderia sp. Tr-20389]|uniref:hypothetical protein n=1 Tax=Paraburkholderia sp. Tr-20389 TaxID=2703903 RepID=UPI0019811CF6|nr:hypothetical protein [Paraburkholderia sp. Tr-20389]MBN3757252.1 hypothetical protein [Paraburkholderia sp. Tr-20389]
MRKFMPLLAGAALSACVVVLSGCPSTPTLTFPQQVAIACGAANGEIAILKADGVFTGGAADTLSKTVQPDLEKVCAVGATITRADLQTIVNATLPLVKSFVDESALPQDKKNVADAAIDSGVLAFNIAISLAPTVAASAPVAASAVQ